MLNQQQTHLGVEESIYSQKFGESLSSSNRSNTLIRHAFQNIRNFGTYAKHERLLELKQLIDENQIVIFGTVEVNVEWKNL